MTSDGTATPRSRSSGFDYNPPGNSLVFLNTRYDAGDSVVVSDKRWGRQTRVE